MKTTWKMKINSRLSFSLWSCELCSQQMDCLTENFTKYFKSINKFDLFLSFCRWKVLGIAANLNFWCIFSCIKKQTSTKYHKKTGWHCHGSQEGKTKKTPCPTVQYCTGTEEMSNRTQIISNVKPWLLNKSPSFAALLWFHFSKQESIHTGLPGFPLNIIKLEFCCPSKPHMLLHL